MNIKDFPREENPSTEDLILIQKGGVTKHVQIGDLPGNTQGGLTTEVLNELAKKAPFYHFHEILEVNGLVTPLVMLDAHLNDEELIKHKISDISDLQTALNQKADISQIGNPVKLFSVNPPTNPLSGVVWVETDANSNPVEEWTWINNQWISPKEFYVSTQWAVSGITTFIFPMDNAYNYFLRKFTSCLNCNVFSQSTNGIIYVEARHFNSSNSFRALSLSPSYSGLITGDVRYFKKDINTLIPTQNPAYDYVEVLAVPQPTNNVGYRLGAKIDYFLIRK
jgi:hypothetical protein